MFEDSGITQSGELEVQGYGCDVSDEKAVIATMEQIVRRFGRIDVMISAAGIVGQLVFTSSLQCLTFETDIYPLMCIREFPSGRLPRRSIQKIILNKRRGIVLLRS